jgi:predicted HicB family RNase H-like nuclease
MKAAESASFQLRLDKAVKEKLTEEAQRNFRSLNNEINKRLAESLDAGKEKAPNA